MTRYPKSPFNAELFLAFIEYGGPLCEFPLTSAYAGIRNRSVDVFPNRLSNSAWHLWKDEATSCEPSHCGAVWVDESRGPTAHRTAATNKAAA